MGYEQQGGGSMKQSEYEENYQDLAVRMYELDTAVYEASGSELGKVFPGSKTVSVQQIQRDFEQENIDKIRDELILIRNMVQMLEDQEKEGWEELAAEYEALRGDMQVFWSNEDLLHQQLSKDFTDDKFGLMHKKPEEHVVICIARQTGAGGHEIGYRLAERLGIGFYDDNIMDMMIEEMHESFPGLGGKDAHFIKQSQLIANIARREDCVIVGRSCGHVLMVQNIPRLSVFVGAALEKRVRRKMLLTKKSRKEVEDMIKRSDKLRKASYNYYTGKKWGHAEDFDICINSACYGIDGSVELLENLVKFSLEQNK